MIKSFWAESYPCCVPGMFVNYVTNTQAENSVHKLLCELCERGKTECRRSGVDSERNTVVWSGFTRKHGRLKHSKGWHVVLMEYVRVFCVTDMCRWLRSSFKPVLFVTPCSLKAVRCKPFPPKFLRAETKFRRVHCDPINNRKARDACSGLSKFCGSLHKV